MNLVGKLRGFGSVAAVAAFGLGASSVAAETLTVEGIYGAQANLPADIVVIATETFAGDSGADVSLELTDRLGGVYIDGEPFFRVVPAGIAPTTQVVVIDNSGDGDPERVVVDDPNAPDAILRGTVSSNYSEMRLADQRRNRCVTTNADGDCTERRDVTVTCFKYTVQLSPRLRMTDASGRELYALRDRGTKSVQACETDNVDIDPEEMRLALVSEMVANIRRDLAPVQSRRSIRIMESRKGLKGDDREAFKAAVKLTNDNPNAACTAFEALEANNPTNVSVLFNIGLCYEQAGALVLAQDYYNRALESDPGRDYPTSGLARIASAFLGQEQMEARYATQGDQ
ncbi:MAG: hypothetical protein AAF687_05540 [Pseudomonadota bacterium]